MNKDCRFCKMIFDKNTSKLYEDEKVVAMLEENPAAYGHVLVMPKEHYPIIEMVPDFIVSHAFAIANKISVALFESLHAHGTNIIVNNGIAAGQESAHFMINVIPRREKDGLNFQWAPKQLTEEEMSTVELQLKEEAKAIGNFQKEKQKPIEITEKPRKIESSEENYLFKRVRRIP
ncbi:MAG: HIT domain-containing protein [Candidatus Woesearchaeota archaeon]|nr:HIT domain-containing protein [Candidatus Woesearchaeota archaeon]